MLQDHQGWKEHVGGVVVHGRSPTAAHGWRQGTGGCWVMFWIWPTEAFAAVAPKTWNTNVQS